MKLYSPDACREADRRAIEEFAVPSRLLMEVAGRAAADVAEEVALGPSAVVLSGAGNNGGDGFVCARHLASRGLDVVVLVFADRSRFSEDTAANFALLERWGIPAQFVSDESDLLELSSNFGHYGVMVDALLGTGFHGEPKGLIALAIALTQMTAAPVLSLDVPSGVDAATGVVPGIAVQADITVTFGLPKVGLFLHPGLQYVGELRQACIGLPPEVKAGARAEADLVTREVAASILEEVLECRRPDAHKGSLGTLLVVAGSRGMSGAAILAARAALHLGAGLVKVAVPESIWQLVDSKVVEAITVPLPETEAGTLALASEARLLEELRAANAVAIGPGLGRHPETQQLVRSLLPQLEIPLVLDADGLNALEGAAFLKSVSAPMVLTPHPGELASLMEIATVDVLKDRLTAARQAAAASGATVVLKGASTLIAEPMGALSINPTGNEGMATGGSGDVLTGLIGSLLAQKHSPVRSARLAVYLHGLAGDLAAPLVTRPALLPSDLVMWVADAVKALQQS